EGLDQGPDRDVRPLRHPAGRLDHALHEAAPGRVEDGRVVLVASVVEAHDDPGTVGVHAPAIVTSPSRGCRWPAAERLLALGTSRIRGARPAATEPARPPAAEEDAGAKYAPLPKGERKGIGLCLSGGGFRATLFHLGVLRRLNEMRVLSRSDFRTVASVSGGSIMAAQLATALTRIGVGPGREIPRAVWEAEVQAPLRAFTKRDARTGPFLAAFVPWKAWRAGATVEALAARYERDLTHLRLAALPARPEFLFLATDMAYGVSWVFSRGWMG